MSKQTRLEAALARLIARLRADEDREFPDECWRAAQAFLVPYEALADAYDQHCAEKASAADRPVMLSEHFPDWKL